MHVSLIHFIHDALTQWDGTNILGPEPTQLATFSSSSCLAQPTLLGAGGRAGRQNEQQVGRQVQCLNEFLSGHMPSVLKYFYLRYLAHNV